MAPRKTAKDAKATELLDTTSLTPAAPAPMKFDDPIKDDFRNFLYLAWQHLGLPKPTPEQYDIAHYLQHGPKKKMIMAFRGVGKSWIYGAFVCWRLLRNPDWKIMVVSASKPYADALSQFVKRLIEEMPVLQHLKAGKGQRDSLIMFDVGPARTSKDPSVKSVGITGQLTGSRADEIIADDIESLNNSATQTARDFLLEVVKEFAAIAKPETGFITYLGTPQTEMSMYNSLPDRGYEIRVWPARIPADVDKYKGRLAPFIMDMIAHGAKPGQAVSPRFPDLDLLEREGEYGRSGFTLQFMLDTTLSDVDRYPLRVRDLLVMALDHRMAPAKLVWSNGADHIINDLPNVALAGDRYYTPMWTSQEMAEFTGSVLAIDPSGKGKDETAYAVVKILHGNLYLTASGGFKDGFGEATLKALSVVAKTHDVKMVIIEENYGGGMFAQLFKPVVSKIHPVTVEEVKHSVQKERRIADTLEPLMNQHRLIFDRKVIEDDYRSAPDTKYSLIYQLSRLTREKGALGQDDRLDALSIAVAYWIEHMSRDTDTAASDHKEAILKKSLEDFMTTTIGYKAGNDTWIRV